MRSKRIINASYALASSRQMCCADDLTLLRKAVMALDSEPKIIVQIGAGSGTMALVMIGQDTRIHLTTVDISLENINWEKAALGNVKADLRNYRTVVSDSSKAARRFKADSVDFLVIDGDHSYEGVIRDLAAWTSKLKDGALLFLHDYDGRRAPLQYPGVRKAAIEQLGRPMWKEGWSGVWKIIRQS